MILKNAFLKPQQQQEIENNYLLEKLNQKRKRFKLLVKEIKKYQIVASKHYIKFVLK
jgi:hypothetical protein